MSEQIYSPTPIWTARFADTPELEKLFKNVYGISAGYEWSANKEMFYNPEPEMFKPIMSFGGMGSLKTTSGHIPFALRFGLSKDRPGSLLILESTGETSATCLHYRQKFQPTYQINPQGAHERLLVGIPHTTYNALDPYWMNPRRPKLLDSRAAKIATGCAEEQVSRDPYWDMTSRDVVEVTILSVVELSPPGKANIGRVASLIHDDWLHYAEWAATRVSPNLRTRLRRYRNADQIKSILEVIQNTCTQTKPFVVNPISECLKTAGIRIGDLRRKPMTLSIMLPLETLSVFHRFLKYFLEQTLAELQSEQFDGDVPVGILIDEAAQYKKSESLALAMSSLRKFNCFPWICINDYGSLVHLYGREQADTFLQNAGLVQFMSTKDVAGSELLEKLLGFTEVFHSTMSTSNPDVPKGAWAKFLFSGKTQGSTSENWMTQKRPLLAAFEIRQNLGPRDQIIWLPDHIGNPILCHKIPYFETKLAKLARPNPYARNKKESFWS